MTQYEYKVVPAPRKGTKAKGVKAPEDRFALSLQELMNQEAAQGWEFQRAETLPSEERAGLRGSKTIYRDVLVFRRAQAAQPDVPETPAQPSVNPGAVDLTPKPAPFAEPMPAPSPRSDARNDPPMGERPSGDEATPQVIFRAPPRDSNED